MIVMAYRGVSRSLYVFTAILLVSTRMAAQGYFLDRTGVTLEYVRTSVADGKFTWRHSVTITGVTETGTHTRYSSESVFTKQNGKPLYRSAVIETTLVDRNSQDLSFDLGEAMASYVKARIGLNATSTSVLSVLPATLEPGDTLQSVAAYTKVGPLTYNVKVNERKVLRRETVSVPAGTFDCIVVSENRAETGPGHNRHVTNITWYSKGIGYVRHDTYINGRLDTSEVLQSIKNQ